MIKSVELGKNYSLKLLDIYGATITNLQVVGTTNINNVANNTEDYNIYSTFFEPLGLGLASYYAAINNNTVIYICNTITSLNPFEVSIDDKVYIPESLIDFDGTDEIVRTVKYDFAIGSIYRKYVNTNEINTFKKEIIEKLKKRLSGMIDISINEIEIEVSNSDVYLTKEKIDSIETERSDLYKDYLSKQRENIDINTTREKKYNETLYEMNAKINEYDELIKTLELEKQRYSGLCVSLQNKIDSLGE
jgi:hypothetical protein